MLAENKQLRQALIDVNLKNDVLRTDYRHQAAKLSDTNQTKGNDIVEKLVIALNKKGGGGKTQQPFYRQNNNARHFVSLFRLYRQMEEMDNEHACLAFKSSIKDDVALMGITRLSSEIQGDFEKLIEEFLKLHDGNSKEFYKTTLLTAIKQLPTESALEYYRRFLMAVDSDRDDTDLVAEYCRGLKTKLKIYINTGEVPKVLSDAVKIAGKYEDLLKEQDGIEEMRPKMHRLESITEEEGLSSTLINTLQTLGDTNTHMKVGIMKDLGEILKKLDEPKQQLQPQQINQQPQQQQQQEVTYPPQYRNYSQQPPQAQSNTLQALIKTNLTREVLFVISVVFQAM
jgi:hypothetical protein